MLPRVWCHHCDSYRLFASEIGREAKATNVDAQKSPNDLPMNR